MGYGCVHVDCIRVNVVADIVCCHVCLWLVFSQDPSRQKKKKMSALKRLHILLITSLLLALPSYLPLSCPLLWFPVGGLRRNLIDPVNILCLPPPMGRRAGVRRVVAQRLCCKSESAAVTYIYSSLVVSRRLCTLLDSPVYLVNRKSAYLYSIIVSLQGRGHLN